uniref:Uncharacterized protein n=1 Tax=Annulohypoxylon stygium TaxID=326628 RepID=A0A386RW57_9PEZI|nr:hypothetical protein [Annulohypoxylon stygium]
METILSISKPRNHSIKSRDRKIFLILTYSAWIYFMAKSKHCCLEDSSIATNYLLTLRDEVLTRSVLGYEVPRLNIADPGPIKFILKSTITHLRVRILHK